MKQLKTTNNNDLSNNDLCSNDLNNNDLCNKFDDENFHMSNNKINNVNNNDINKYINSKVNKLDMVVINLYQRGLDAFPLDIPTNIQILCLDNNKITIIPSSISNLSNLRILYLSGNRIRKLPSSIGNLTNLEELYLDHNFLTSLPESMKNLNKLSVIYLQNNQLTSISSTNTTGNGVLSSSNVVANTIQSTTANNIIQSTTDNIIVQSTTANNILPCNIQEIHLDNNLITILPIDIKHFKSIKIMSLNGNPLVERGNNDGMGKYELMVLFGDRISFDHVILTSIHKQTVYDKLIQQKIHWNVDVLRQCKLDSKQIRCPEDRSYEILNSFHSKNLIPTIVYEALTKYVRKLNHPEIEYDRWPMYKEFSSEINDTLGSILIYLNNQINIKQAVTKNASSDRNNSSDRNTRNDSSGKSVTDYNNKNSNDSKSDNDDSCEWLKFILNTIYDSVQNFCPDRQIAEIRAMNQILTETYEEDNLSSFIRKALTIEKEMIFDSVFTPLHSKQNVHVLNYWKYTLREDLGFKFDFNPRIILRNEDPFGGCPGNALDAFFIKFTPEYVVDTLTELINGNKRMMCELMKIVVSDEQLTAEDRALMGLDDPYLRFDRVTSKAVEYILTKENILIIT